VQQTEGGLQTVRATLANAKLQLDYCRITAPISGRIGLRLVDQGNIVRANDSNGLAVITQLQPISLLFTIPQDDIIRVQKEMRVGESLAVDAFDRDFKTKLATGKLVAVDNQVDPTTGTVRLKAVFENEDSSLFPNQFVNARLLVDTQRNALTVPSAAVQRGPNSTFVYVVQSDETVELRNIEIGPAEGSETSIINGLSAGEIVVTEGLDKLQPKAKVTTRDKSGERGGVSPPVKSSETKKRSQVLNCAQVDQPERASVRLVVDSLSEPDASAFRLISLSADDKKGSR
jgi:multidrug efflux system membrane fusion protein